MNADDELILTTTRGGAWRFDLALPVLFRPRSALARVAESSRPIWRAPILLLVLAAVAHALVAGSFKAAAAAAGELTLPPGFEFYTPEQQAQFMQAVTATNNPTFNYLLPALGAALGVVVVWLVTSWLLHLILTLFGGRGTSGATLNGVAWSSMPIVVRYVVQLVAMLLTDRLIGAPGLSGFAPAGEGFVRALLAGVLSNVDIYLLWQIVLLVIGVRLSSQLPAVKCWSAVLLTVLIVLVLRALPGAIMAQFGGLTVIRPFM